MALKAIYSLFESIFHEKTWVFFGLLGTIFFFVLLQNWFGLLPGVGSLLIKESGGEFVGLDGKPVTIETQVALGGNSKLVAKALPLLQKCYQGYKGFK